MSDAATRVEFYFDPICPWCWMTSRWASEVAKVRGFDIDWRPISLKIINEHDDGSGDESGVLHQGHRLGRVAVAAAQQGNVQSVGKLYTAFGTRIHPGGREDFDAILSESLNECELSGGLAEAADTSDADAQLRANTEHALAIAGPDVGVPIISVNGVAFFGPVVTPAPTGDDALRLWDALVAAASVPGFYELKRGRTEGPKF